MTRTRGIVAISIGNLLEWYDFTVYALFAGYLAGNFFPAGRDPAAALLETFLVFGGFAPSILTWFTQRSTGALFAPAWYVMLAAVVALAAVPFLKAVGTTGGGAPSSTSERH